MLDLLFERHAPFNPSEVTAEIAALLKSYGCLHVVGDKYAAKWVIEAFAKVGISYRHSDADRSSVYLDCLPLFTSGRVRLIDSPRLMSQFAALERRVFPTGRDRVDHGRAGRDDACNAAAGALVLAAKRARHAVPIVQPGVFSNGRWWDDGQANTPAPAGYRPTNEPWRSYVAGPDIGLRTFGPPPCSGPREW